MHTQGSDYQQLSSRAAQGVGEGLGGCPAAVAAGASSKKRNTAEVTEKASHMACNAQ